MRIGIYLTCQGKFFNAILNYLPLGTEIFYEENWVMFSENRMPTHEWLDLDYFIYQPIIEPQKPAYADANILGNYVSASAKKIRVPYLMFTGLTPWRQYADSPQLGTEHRNCWLDKSLAENDNVERAIGETMLRTGLDISSNAEE